jgi:hypothetical protein
MPNFDTPKRRTEMPFSRTDVFPNAVADVQILFTGLLLLTPDDTGGCYVGVDNVAPDHELTINVTARGTGQVLATLPGSLNLPLLITVDPPTGNGVLKYTSLPEPFERTYDRDPRDIRWSVDFKRLNPKMGIDYEKITPGITVTDGLLYSAEDTNPAQMEVDLIAPDGTVIDWLRVGAVIGMNIYLQPGQTVLFEWNNSDGPQKLVLPQPDSIGSGYDVAISNDPPAGAPYHNDFKAYYNIITNVPPELEYDLIFIPSNLTVGQTQEQPCMSGLGDGGGG